MLAIYLLVISLLYVVCERLLLSSLSKIPGPTLAAATRLVLMYHEFTRARKQWIHGLHLRYGPVVRIAPNEVSFATWEAVKEIYTSQGSGYEKTSFYRLLDNFNTQCMVSLQDRGTHGGRKRMFADRYTKSYIMRPEAVSGIQDRVTEFITKCTETAGKAVDIYSWLHCYGIDCATHHLFDPMGTRTLTDPNDRAKMEEITFQDVLTESFREYYITEMLPSILLPYVEKYVRRPAHYRGIMAHVLETVRLGDVASHTVLHKLFGKLDTTTIASDLMDQVVAGHDTTGDGLCFLMYHLSLPSSASIQEKLHQELVNNPGTPIDDLPYLDAVLKESLRRFSPVPMGLPRKVPKGGRMIGDVFVPENTIVSCQAHTLHRVESVFPNPEEFVPERWLAPEGALERNQFFFTFGTGGRVCLGKHLALLEMKMLLREVYSTYRTRVAPEMTASMEIDDQVFVSRPKGQTCLILFEKIV